MEDWRNNKVCGREPGTRGAHDQCNQSLIGDLDQRRGFPARPSPPTAPMVALQKQWPPGHDQSLGWVMAHSAKVLYVAAWPHGCCTTLRLVQGLLSQGGWNPAIKAGHGVCSSDVARVCPSSSASSLSNDGPV